jgi:Fanconi anemia group M protein
MIKDFKPRLYQEAIFAETTMKNTLVVLPTGMGKTNIFLMLAAHRRKLYPGSKILLLGPTKPLIDQYYKVFQKHFDIPEDRMAIMTGHVKPENRHRLWKESQVIFSTPQGLENDIISSKVDLSNVSLVGFDEAHRAVGNYSYVYIAKSYQELSRYPRIVAMTASPGSSKEKIKEVVDNLFIEGIEIRNDESPDVKPYIQKVDTQWEEVRLPQEFMEILKHLRQCFRSKLVGIKEYGFLDNVDDVMRSKKDLLLVQAKLQSEIMSGNREIEVLRSISLAAEALKVSHALELIESQGLNALDNYLETIFSQSYTTKVKAVQNLVKDTDFRSAHAKTKTLIEKGFEHPKLKKLADIVESRIKKDSRHKIMVFTQFRDSGSFISGSLNKIEKVESRVFFGQAKKNGTGMSQKKQIEILDEYRKGKFNVLVSSSIGEEGLDIPQVDTVLFYEPIPSAIRHIQRRGRTGRLARGKVIVLVAKGTRDEAYKWSAHHKEQRMYRNLEEIKKGIVLTKKNNNSLNRYLKEDDKVKVYADYREKANAVIKELIDLGADLSLESLACGDYLVSQNCCIEFKTCEDFIDSLIDGRLLGQLRTLKENYSKPCVIVEGTRDIYAIRNVHPNAIRGLLATIAVSYNIPILFTKNHFDTASMIMVIARREQDETGKVFSFHSSKKQMSDRQQQEFVVSALPGVGPALSKPLLKKFRTIGRIMNASEEELKKTPLIGDRKARAIKGLIEKEYEEH